MNLFDYINSYAIRNPNHPAITTGKEHISYEQLEQYINRAANYMLSLKYKLGEVVLLKLTDKKNFILMFLSVLKIGCRVVPIPDDIKPKALDKLSKRVNAKGIIDDSTFCEEIFYDTRISTQFDKVIQESEFYHITSGTTGGEKICIRTVESLTREGEAYRDALNFTADDILLGLSPLYHSFALGAILAGAFTSGACIYAVNKFVPRTALELIHKERITRLVAVPIMIKLLCVSNTDYQTKINSLRTVLVGGGPITEEIMGLFKQKFGICISPTYGSTETGGLLLCNQEQYKKSVGLPLPGVEVKIVDSEGKAGYRNCQGELWVRCQGLLRGYLNNPFTVLDEEGYFPMGDLVYADEKGYIYIVGRIKNMINIGGKKVNPLEVEEVIKKMDCVKECVVLGLKQKEKEVIKAVIVPGGNIKEEDVRRHCLNELESYKLPSIIEMHSQLPKNEMGKIKKDELMEENYGVLS
jgi:long-chain acyl-CoA synthetase